MAVMGSAYHRDAGPVGGEITSKPSSSPRAEVGTSSTNLTSGKAVVVERHAEDSSFDLVCEAVNVLMQQGTPDFDDAFDELLGLAIDRGERLDITANLVVTLAETGDVLGTDG